MDELIKFTNHLDSNIKIKFKNESLLMKFLSYILFFNKNFMSHYITTINSTVYYPNKQFVEQNKHSAMRVMAHEFVHIKDSKKFVFLFKFLYLFPISLIPLLTPLFWVISWYWVIGLMLACLTPGCAPFRKYFELRAYRMSLFALGENTESLPLVEKQKVLIESAVEINKNFINADYWFMWVFGVRSSLTETVGDILNDRLVKTEDIYVKVREAFKKTNDY